MIDFRVFYCPETFDGLKTLDENDIDVFDPDLKTFEIFEIHCLESF